MILLKNIHFFFISDKSSPNTYKNRQEILSSSVFCIMWRFLWKQNYLGNYITLYLQTIFCCIPFLLKELISRIVCSLIVCSTYFLSQPNSSWWSHEVGECGPHPTLHKRNFEGTSMLTFNYRHCIKSVAVCNLKVDGIINLLTYTSFS